MEGILTKFETCKLCKWNFYKISNRKTGICQYCEAFKVINGSYPVGAYSHKGEVHTDVPIENLTEFVAAIRKTTTNLKLDRNKDNEND